MPDWPHAPIHRLEQPGAYMVTAGTYLKAHHFREPARLTFLHDHLLRLARQYEWDLQAWAVFSNHYHFVAISPAKVETLRRMAKHLHADTAREINRLDGATGRKVWHQYWDTHLTYPPSYFARLNYTLQNPVRHGLVRVATAYPWCSAGWFERTAAPSFRKTVLSFKTDRVNVLDDFQVAPAGTTEKETTTEVRLDSEMA